VPKESETEDRRGVEKAGRFRRLRRLVIAGVSIPAYLLIGYVRRDEILVRSERDNQMIIVRLVSNVPLWAWPLEFLPQARSHRCEYYRHRHSWIGRSRLWSCVSRPPGDSWEPRSAEVEWPVVGHAATVRVRGFPPLTCRYGEWSELKPR